MPCYQPNNFPPGFTATGRTGYATEADCNNACQEGACCEGTTCSVKPQCQCQGTGKVFKGVGTTCTPNPCLCCCQFSLSVTSQVQVPPDACTSIANRKLAGCSGVEVTALVSGWVDAELAVDPDVVPIFGEANKDLSFANGPVSASEICGSFGSGKEGPRDLIAGGFWVVSSVFSVIAEFSRTGWPATAQSPCSTGSVRLGVSVSLRRVYRLGAYGLGYVLDYDGDYVSDCVSIDSLSTSGSLLSGTSLTLSCSGSFSALPFFSYPVQPQDITVSFSSNPLP